MNEDNLTRKFARRSKLIGDDCAVLQPKAGEDLLFTTDFTIEGVHFPPDLAPEQVGWRALARSLSDIAAMGGSPRYCLVALALRESINEDWVDRFYGGLMELAIETGTELAGGDLSHAGQIVCDVTVCGSVPRGKAIHRDGAKPGDILYVSGPLGGWTHRTSIHARLDIGRQLLGKATACIDITDGLALDLHRVLIASQVSAALEEVPLLSGASLQQALHDGEDYELLYTASPRAKVPGIRLGRIQPGTAGAITYQGESVYPKGYDHFDRS